MVKLYAICLFYKRENKTEILQEAYDLQSLKFFQRGVNQVIRSNIFNHHWTMIDIVFF
jgi:hypothetical protein